MAITNQPFKSSEKFTDDKYKFHEISNGSKNLRRITCDSDSICIIPFDTRDGKISNIYLAGFVDFLNEKEGHTCISVDCKKEGYSSQFEEVSDIIKNELNINIDVDDLYFLGNINHNLPFTKKYKCYGVNLDDYANSMDGFKLDIPDAERQTRLYSLDKIRFSRVINGDISDSICLSASLLLSAYINN